MNTKKMSAVPAELMVEATASLKQEVEKELQIPDPAQSTAADWRLWGKDAHVEKEPNGQGKDTP